MKENNLRVAEADTGGRIMIINTHKLHDEVTQIIKSSQTTQQKQMHKQVKNSESCNSLLNQKYKETDRSAVWEWEKPIHTVLGKKFVIH
jgi:hypothetical protein